MARGTHENEIKLKVADVVSAKRMLYQAGFRVHKRRVFEDNVVFDTPQQTLRRVGLDTAVARGGRPGRRNVQGQADRSKHKSREELETKVADAGMARLIFERLGFQQRFRYQKYRTEYKQPGKSGIATLDETPIGVYVELEGPPGLGRSVRPSASGFRSRITSRCSYGRLYLEFCETNRCQPGDMVW